MSENVKIILRGASLSPPSRSSTRTRGCRTWLAVSRTARCTSSWYAGKDDRQGLGSAVPGEGGRAFRRPDALLAGGWVPPSQVALATDAHSVWIVWDGRREADAAFSLAGADVCGRTRRLRGEAAGSHRR